MPWTLLWIGIAVGVVIGTAVTVVLIALEDE